MASSSLNLEDARAIVNKLGSFKDPEVLSFELRRFSDEPLGYMGVHELLRVEARERSEPAGVTRSLSFFVKSKNPSAVDFDELIFREESAYFEDALPRMLEHFRAEPWSAECYLVKEAGVIVLEDLRARGFRVPAGSLEGPQLRLALMCVARFHAAGMLLETRSGETLDRMYPGLFQEKIFVKNDGGSAWKWLATGIEVGEAVARGLGLDPQPISTAYESAVERSGPSPGRRNVLCHCDLWFNNIMFDEKNQSCRLVDFQMLAYASYAFDLVQLVYLNTRPQERRKIEGELLELYHSTLIEILKSHGYKEPLIDIQEIRRDYEEKRICGLVTAVQFLPIVFWSKDAATAYADPNTCLYYMYESRKDLVLKEMHNHEDYRIKMEDIVKDLLEYTGSAGKT